MIRIRLFDLPSGVLIAALAACSSSNPPASVPADGGGTATAPGTAAIGEPCPNGASDCASGLGCDSGDPGGGQCFLPCTPGKSQDSECGDTSKFVCSSEGHCYPICTSVSDCKRASEGYVCKDDSPPRPPIKFCDAPD